jgi:hypothetical protein
VRPAAYAAVSLSVLALAACSDGAGGHEWAGPPDPAADGAVAVEEFAEHQESIDEPWEGTPALAAAEFLRLDERTAATTTIRQSTVGEGTGPATVTVTLDGVFDDSVRAERWTLVFEPEGETYVLVSARRAQRCQPERGHQDFSPEACL